MNSNEPNPSPPSSVPDEGNAANLLREALEHSTDQTVPVAGPVPSGVRDSGDVPLPDEVAALLPRGDYAVEKFLGQGGMGAVYKGTQVRLQRPVAIKIMRRDQGRDHGFEERFRREALALAKLNHPNVVNVIDCGEAGPDYLYIVMEFVDGADLMDVIRTGRMTQEMALILLPQICDALQFAHDHGIVHRDIKPANILLTRDGRIKVADFGLAKRFDAASSFRTQSGAGMGTPDYAAPEQFNDAGVVDHRADIYALGVMMYQMLTGHLPRGVWQPPSQKAAVNPQWDAIVAHAMQSDPRDRYANTGEIKRDITHISSTPVSADKDAVVQSAKSAAPTAKKTSTGAILGILGTVAMIATGVFFATRKPSAMSPTVPPSDPQQPGKSRNAPAISAASVGDPPNTTRRVTDLMPLVDVKRDAMSGTWTARGADLVLEPGLENARRIQFPHPVSSAEYDFEIEFSSLDEKPIHVGQRFPAAGTYLYWAMNLFKDSSERYFGFPSLDGQSVVRMKEAGNHEAGIWKVGLLPSGRRHRSVVKVRKNSLTGVLNGEVVMHWEGDLKRFRETGSNPTRDPRFPVVSADDTGIIIHKAVITEFFPLSASPVLHPGFGNVPGTATKDAPFVNSLGMKFVAVPGTEAMFCIWDTRVKDYASYAATNKVGDGWKKYEKDGVPVSREPEYPVVGVTWVEAKAFCQWLTEKEHAEGKLPQGMKYRLPMDEEWSRAVGLAKEDGATPKERSGKNQVDFPWGAGYPPPEGKGGNYADSAFHEKFPKALWNEGYGDGYATTSPVGSFPSNSLGLFDMGGNVWQWCEDWFDETQQGRTLRGNSWSYAVRSLQLSSARIQHSPDQRSGNLNCFGFRCVIVPVNSEPRSVAVPVATMSATATATQEQPFTNTLGMKFVPVPITGGPTDGKRVLFSMWETRVQDYEVFATETKHAWPKRGFSQDPTHPAVNVSWDDAQAFCTWLTERERSAGKLDTNHRYRLPTDHEWSCAIGIGDREDAPKPPSEKSQKLTDVYPWGSTWPPSPDAGNFSGEEVIGNEINASHKGMTGFRDDFIATSPVGSFPANRLGLFDLSGDVWEWCEDQFSSGQNGRVLRGASWRRFGLLDLLSSNRTYHVADGRNDDHGFRCVLEVSAPHASPPLPATSSAPSKMSAPSSSTFVTLSLDEIANRSIENFKSQAVGRVVLNGVPFDFNAAPKFFVTQIRWIRDAPTSGTLKVNVANPSSLYVLVCGAGGGAPELQGKEIGVIRLGFADGSEHVARLRMGVHLRREVWASNDTNPTTPPGDDTIQVTNGIVEPQPFQRGRPATAFMDMLTIALPAAKVRTSLASITFADTSSETANDAAPGFEVHAVTVGRGQTQRQGR